MERLAPTFDYQELSAGSHARETPPTMSHFLRRREKHPADARRFSETATRCYAQRARLPFDPLLSELPSEQSGGR